MPDQFWCLDCENEYTSQAAGSCPHCGAKLQNMEGLPEEGDAEKGPQEYVDKDADANVDGAVTVFDDDATEGLQRAA